MSNGPILTISTVQDTLAMDHSKLKQSMTKIPPSSSSFPCKRSIDGLSSMKNINATNSMNKAPPSLVNFSMLQFKGPPTPIELCAAVIDCKQPNADVSSSSSSNENSTDERLRDRWVPANVTKYVYSYIQRWGRVVPVHPEQFLQRILQSRGYETSYNSFNSPSRPRKPPTAKQIQDYDNELVWAIRNADMKKLYALRDSGRSMAACNKYSESILHMACRRSDCEIVQFLLSNGADIQIVDDFGRTPLHDACWRVEPRFDIVTVIMDANIDLLLYTDVRGSMPLHYVREEHWVHWCAYLYNQMEKYWAPRNSRSNNNYDSSSSGNNSSKNENSNSETTINSTGSLDEEVNTPTGESNSSEEYFNSNQISDKTDNSCTEESKKINNNEDDQQHQPQQKRRRQN